MTISSWPFWAANDNGVLSQSQSTPPPLLGFHRGRSGPTKGRRVHPRPHPQSRVNTVGGGLDLSFQSSTIWAGQQPVDSPLSRPRNENCLKQCSGCSPALTVGGQPTALPEGQAIPANLFGGGPWKSGGQLQSFPPRPLAMFLQGLSRSQRTPSVSPVGNCPSAQHTPTRTTALSFPVL